jgi:hypothetical protein
MTALGPRIRREQRTIDALLEIYCRYQHGGRGAPCPDCDRLREYAHRRLATCPFQQETPVCNRCEVHCYSQALRERLRDIMCYAGPRMPLRHPWLALRHWVDELRAASEMPKKKPGRRRARRCPTTSEATRT